MKWEAAALDNNLYLFLHLQYIYSKFVFKIKQLILKN